ncbi:MAG: clan AA aspartic protease [bacterium]|nr:clan AA aspartic protease [bacterium]MDE0670032.1 clan AA aspartic protease [bacterium]MYB24801.1 clan AA aspartic protease [Acidimicrobiia bacterium]
MGQTHVMVTVRNPLERQRCWEGRFLVDTGATDSLVPRRCLEAIGIEPRAKRSYRLADGSEHEFDTAFAEFEFMDDLAAVRVIFGDDGCEPLLGVIALESTGTVVDPEGGELTRRAVLRL